MLGDGAGVALAVAFSAYAAARHVTILPEIDVPGHAVAAIAAYPELGCTGATIEVTPLIAVHEDVLCVCREAVMTMLEEVLDEVIDVFDPPTVHLGGDEVPTTQWEASPECAARMTELGLTDVAALRAYAIERLAGYLADRGRGAVAWEDAETAPLPASIALQQWRSTDADVARLADEGHAIVRSPAEEYYLNRSLELTPLAEVYATPVIPTSFDAAQATHVVGLEGCLWTPWIRTPTQLQTFAYPRLSAIAELGWTDPDALDYPGFLARMPCMLERWEAAGIEHAGPEALR